MTLAQVPAQGAVDVEELLQLPLADLLKRAAAVRDEAFGTRVTYSPKVFIPLTHLCRDVCHYCTFAQTPKKIEQPYMPVEQVLELCREGGRGEPGDHVVTGDVVRRAS